MSSEENASTEEQLSPEDAQVTMPELPAKLVIHSAQHFKAIGDPLRMRILGIIQQQPATAKQIANRLKVPPGTIGHHLQVLEAAGLAQVVARRLVHGIVAKYYTRTARLFVYDFPPEVQGNSSLGLQILTRARDEMAEAVTERGATSNFEVGFPHARLSPERVQLYTQRLLSLIDDFLNETPDPEGQVYGLCAALFASPGYLQSLDTSHQEDATASSEEA